MHNRHKAIAVIIAAAAILLGVSLAIVHSPITSASPVNQITNSSAIGPISPAANNASTSSAPLRHAQVIGGRTDQ
ncbi:MAG: hypothetical protein KGH64_01965 [Candidatus Micrarchaeota archaeon]|nr:hypothetical protein [Candidatus Micrarchaeota archaeon]MDE1834082.1 hypothetical protein [Candidatus Micrarchaeota archaeon]MDE1859796.1 hypothetical protein [Candidatus Micrarchaeota archaeon]